MSANIGYKLRQAILTRDNAECQTCGKTNQEQRAERTDNGGLHTHHIIPRRYGGGENPENLVMLCDNCHKQEEAATERYVRTAATPDPKEALLTIAFINHASPRYRPVSGFEG